jgi:hypothetical protein
MFRGDVLDQSRRFHLDTPSLEDKFKELEERRAKGNLQELAQDYAEPRQEEGMIKSAIVKSGHALAQLGLVRLLVRFFPAFGGWLSPAVTLTYDRIRKNADLPALVDEATEKLKDIQHERAQKKILEKD